MPQSATPLPTELLTIKSLKTLSGASITVWIICLVLSSLLPEHVMQYWHYRLIAFVLSVLITFTIIKPKDAGQKLAYWLLILGNTCYIFINASGINSISKNQLFDKPSITITHADSSKKEKAVNHSVNPSFLQAGLFSFGREADWWPDKSLIKENILLREELVSVKSTGGNGNSAEKDSLLQRISVLEEQNNLLKGGKSSTEKVLLDKQAKLGAQIKSLTAALNKEKINNAALTKQINTLNSSLTVCNKQYDECMAKNGQLTKNCISKTEYDNLLKQLNGLKADLAGCQKGLNNERNTTAGLSKSLTVCQQQYKECIGSKTDNGALEKYKNCLANYQRSQQELKAARDSVSRCCSPTMKKPTINKIN